MVYPLPVYLRTVVFFLTKVVLHGTSTNTNKLLLGISIGVSCIAIFCIPNGQHMIWHFDSAVVLLACFELGNYYREKEDMFGGRIPIALSAVIYCASVLIFAMQPEAVSIDINNNVYPFGLVSLISMLSGCIMVFELMKRITIPDLLQLIGRHTLVIYSFHSMMLGITISIINRAFNISIDLHSSPVYMIICGAWACMLCIGIGVVLERVLPEAVGKKRIRRQSV